MASIALVIAHPGHECRIFGWYARVKPNLFVFTAGSRAGDEGRLWFSRQVAAELDVKIGRLFGRHLDRDVYNALLRREAELFTAWTRDLIEELCAMECATVVTDSWQMYNVAHDLVHVMARVAADRASKRLSHDIEVLDYKVAADEVSTPALLGQEAVRIELDDAALSRKRSVAESCPELRQEIAELIAIEGAEAQRIEVLRRPPSLDAILPGPGVLPPYERFGAERVAAGTYTECIRWNQHVAPAIAAIRSV